MIYKGSSKIKDVYFGSTKIKEIYHGSTLVYSSGSSGGVLFEQASAGTYSLTVSNDCTVRVDLIGGGGGGRSNRSTEGGSGAYISGNITLLAGTYTIVVGAGGAVGGNDGGASTFNGNRAGGGYGAASLYDGAGGTYNVITAGLSGQQGIEGDNVGWINGYGAGGGRNQAGTDGYCKIEVV